jgi:hypothetical protein
MYSLRESFAIFTNMCRSLANTWKFNEAFPEFLKDVATLEFDFQRVYKFSALIFNSCHPDYDARTHLETCAISQAGRTLIHGWRSLIGNFNRLNVRMFFPILGKAIGGLENAVLVLGVSYRVGTLQSTVPRTAVEWIMTEIWSLKRLREEEIERPEGVQKRIMTLAAVISRAFLHMQEYPIMIQKEVILRRLELKKRLKEVLEIIQGIAAFNETLSHVRESVMGLNAEFAGLFRNLHVNYEMSMEEERGKITLTAPICEPIDRSPRRAPRRAMTVAARPPVNN